MTLGELLFESSDVEVIVLQHHMKELILSLTSSTQIAEIKVKDTKFCESAGRDERRISNIVMICSDVLPQVTYAPKQREELKIRKRRNYEARECTYR